MSVEKSNARARMAYTRERYTTALNFIRQHGLTDGLVPAAGTPAQALFEAAVLHALAAGMGDRTPDSFEGAPYGIECVRPSAESLALELHPAAIKAVASCLLPRYCDDGHLLGVPGLRAHLGHKKWISRLSWPDDNATVEILNCPPKDLASNCPEVASTDGLWTLASLTDREHEARETLKAQLEQAGQWSTCLRRIGLLTTFEPLDLVKGLPTEEQLAGPKPWKLTPKNVVPKQHHGGAVVFSFNSGRKGGQGNTTLVLNAGAALAAGGDKVLIIDHDRYQKTLSAAFGYHRNDGSNDQQAWRIVEHMSSGGYLGLSWVPDHGTGPRLRNLVNRARQEFDYILIDSGTDPDASREAEDEADAVVVPVRLTPAFLQDLLTYTEATDTRSPTEQLYQWLDERFWRLLGDILDDDYDDHDEPELDDWFGETPFNSPKANDWLSEQREDFLNDIASTASREWGTIWQDHSNGWSTHNQRLWADPNEHLDDDYAPWNNDDIDLSVLADRVYALENSHFTPETIIQDRPSEETATELLETLAHVYGVTPSSSGKRRAVLINGINEPAPALDGLYQAAPHMLKLGVRLCSTQIPYTRTSQNSQAQGPVVCSDPLSETAETFTKLATELRQLASNPATKPDTKSQ